MRRRFMAALLLFLGACASGPGFGAADPGLGPALTIERFLNAANAVAQLSEAEGQGAAEMADGIEAMARLFGTQEGSILERDPRSEVERRMYLIAHVLQHTDYRLTGERAVPGRSREMIEVRVRLTTDGGVKEVPFRVVRASGDEWLIEYIGLEAVTGT